MAEIRKITRSAPLSNFSQAAPEAGGAFRFLSGAMQEAYDFLAPAAEAEMKARGAGLGAEIAKQQIGDPKGATIVASQMNYSGDLAGGIKETADALGMDPLDLATIISYETGGTFDPKQPGPTTQWGQHRGLIQFGEPQAKEYGVDWNNPVGSQLGANGAIARYFRKAGYQPGMGLLDAYSAVNAGAVGRYNASDANNGGAPGTVADKVNNQMGAHRDKAAALLGGTSTVTSSAGTPAPTMLREADGKLTARLYSPLAGPLLQLSNAAAGVAYNSEVMLKGMTDVMDLSTQFTGNPEGFREAMQSYTDDLVKAAPDMFKGDVRAGIEKVVQQRFLGMVEEQQREIRQRANNSSAALADRWSETLAEAIAGGNPEEIASARAQLDGVLRSRESLPGIAWTPEQSQNMVLKAEKAGAEIIKRERSEHAKTVKADLSLIAKAAMEGRTAENEGILTNPVVQEMFPDQWREAAASVMLRNEMPSFMRMTPAEQAEALAEMRQQPVSADWEMDLYDAGEKAAKANAIAWEEDPIMQAGKVLPNPPPALPGPEEALQNPQSVTEALAARVAYAEGLKDAGYVDFMAVFSDAEAETYGALMGKDTPPELKAVMAGAIVAAAGPHAAQVFRELKTDDPVTVHAGMLMARGGNSVVATMAMKGQAMLDQGMVQAPTKATTLSAVSPEISSALAALPNSAQASGDTLKFATAIFAAQAPANGLEDEAEKALMEASVQMALGQATNKRGEVTGGVQTIAGGAVLLPPKMSGVKLEAALERAFNGSPELTSGMAGFTSIFGGDPRKQDAAMWTAAGAASVPMLGGQPIPSKHFDKATLSPMGGNMYRLTMMVNGEAVDAADATGKPFIFDAARLIEAMQ